MRLTLASVLLPALLVPIIMNVRVGWGETPFWLFGVLFAGIFTFILLDLIKISEKRYYLFKNIVLWGVMLITILSSFVAAIVVRHQTAPIYNIHDIILQLEAAIRFFLHGTNPYATTYFGTPLEAWNYAPNEINPALYYFVMEPFYLLFSIPFYLISTRTIGFFDGRMPLLFLFISLLVIAFYFIKDRQKRMEAVILLAFNPAMYGYILEGRSDMFMFPFMFVSLIFLHKKKLLLSGIFLALAFTVKQSAWFLLPFYVAYLYYSTKSIKKLSEALVPFAIVALLIVVPFFVWNPQAFLDSTVGYLSGTVVHSYPISGYGLGLLLHKLGFIQDLRAYYPFVIWQIVLGIPILVLLLLFLKKHTNIRVMIVLYGLFLFVYWYMSRYFNNSHVGYLTLIFITAYIWPEEKDGKK